MNTIADSLVHDPILDSITEGVFTVDQEWHITSFNRAAEEITGIPRDRAIGKPCKDILRANICEGRCALGQTMESGNPIVNRSITIVNDRGQRKPVSITTALLKDSTGEIIGGVETFRDLTRIEKLRREIRHQHELADIISRNHRMQGLFGVLPDIAESPSTVLIEGESGTGKELFAAAIHQLSKRSKKPFVAVNCGALPDTLLESELFGYKAGAFTDAKKDKPGRFALAEGGTLFLDEIGDVSPAMQVRLLRFLQERVYEPLGSVAPIRSNVRIVAATHRDLAALVKEGTFREDLFYRINIVKLEIPPLRDRLEDVPLLVEHFIDSFNTLQGKEIAGVSDDALACLMAHDYPGNVRELENLIERAFILCRSGQIEREHLPDPICHQSPMGHTGDPCDGFKQMEAAFLMSALRQHNWNRTETAKALGIHKTTLFRKIKALDLNPPRQGSA
ncbi:MAG: sigma 54-interacting transcriptional regulator [Verrucomicrobia bacterium]|nr:sigma 54-interacting transcriptional regulator [Verrucomicrobiota bacterium]MBT7064752.1 sigma 54-interacting transcriptional regulator [Verrucomicrobiota bacterium]MBT7699168.1 sigma 54-interacting transcriptional regulator [Verrucomicrobiota bacterium]